MALVPEAQRLIFVGWHGQRGLNADQGPPPPVPMEDTARKGVPGCYQHIWTIQVHKWCGIGAKTASHSIWRQTTYVSDEAQKAQHAASGSSQQLFDGSNTPLYPFRKGNKLECLVGVRHLIGLGPLRLPSSKPSWQGACGCGTMTAEDGLYHYSLGNQRLVKLPHSFLFLH
ncbi:uncharacterized protein MYCFIDRAFT_169119 [Pseudocercospora fijiensis CIRAD86]|uniref:Uncharacterized protein n=1 Tax=Pseudocercospora fijiensis (strain CIRAD86) TaxID=383855 RepID=N1Q8Q0_PSEFD|nr:uncharacterized protein MYCFIDRAFT_169119 [Pseudocercospora fijiensis CIRAD86]EME87258.1 hypothetical protein MYCFIDRAFT_169119 [Pseudocercospora fijiensis CIRAD86]